eukprot:TRINITY_DN7290_c0_g1_i5.p1 TRINITY_DN7290_c0_g1~~TRINITY_DN7290_c0_g1_i5.p1  ORF type:complete len:358 (+),score=69.86 TRINITY_DN7290_c0_g1_i5:196-1269(+)
MGEVLLATGNELASNKREGKYAFSENEVYIGSWDLGRMHGYGIYEIHKTYYEGEFQLNLRNGIGVQEFVDGQIYKGEFTNGTPNGKGESYTPNGDHYEGEWKKGKRFGYGTLVFANGNKYEGNWKANEPEGEGKLTLTTQGISYEGFFHAGKPHGKGTLTNLEGTYQGEFDSGRRQGNGKMVSTNKEYEGSWNNDEFHGQGVLSTSEFIYKGSFKNGLFSGKGRIEYFHEDGVYEGQFKAGRKHGKGKYTSKSGIFTSYTGDYSLDLRHGYGTAVFANGDQYFGEFKYGQPCGTGRLIVASTFTYEGKWRDTWPDGKVEVKQDGSPTIIIGDNGNACVDDTPIEYIPPPFLPVFSFQ